MQHFHNSLLDETSAIWSCVQMLSRVSANLFILLDPGLSGMKAVLPEYSNLCLKTKTNHMILENYCLKEARFNSIMYRNLL